MRNQKKVTQYAFIYMEDAGYEERINNKIRELMDKDPEVEFTDIGARIRYKETIEIEETPLTEKGCTFTCGDCPHFQPQTKKDGSPDFRSKYGDCPHSEMHRTWKTNPACELLYVAIKNGDFRLMEVQK